MTGKEKAMKDYNRYLKIKDKIKDREDRAFLIDFLLNEGYKKGLAEGRKEIEKLKKEVESWKQRANELYMQE